MLRSFAALAIVVFVTATFGCSGAPDETPPPTKGSSSPVSACKGKASSTIPADGHYYLTSFGYSKSDDGQMSCGSYTKHGSWYYAASRQRYGCGSKIKIEANGKCVVAQTDDYGPDSCYETAAGKPIIDASPLVSKYLFGVQSAGWSDAFEITVTTVGETTPLGPCKDSAPICAQGTGSCDVPVDAGDACSADVDCTAGESGTGRICGDNGTCVGGCRADADCPSDTPACSDGSCVSSSKADDPNNPGSGACSSDADCNYGNAGTMRICDSNGACVDGCHSDSDCPSDTPSCSAGSCTTSNGSSDGCWYDSDCNYGYSGAMRVCDSSGACVDGCHSDSDCPSDVPTCVLAGAEGTCETSQPSGGDSGDGCASDSDCNGGYSGMMSICDGSGTCVDGCHSDDDCPYETPTCTSQSTCE